MSAFDSGYLAYEEGDAFDSNPFAAGSEDSDEWEAGWVMAWEDYGAEGLHPLADAS